MTLEGALIYVGSFIASGSVLLIALLGVMWAPFGAVICGGTAKNKQLPVLKFAIAGALSSMFLLMPWFYLITRMEGKHFSRPLAVLAYIVAYSIWLYGPLLTYFWYHVVMTMDIDDLSLETSSVDVSNTRIYMIAIGAVLWTVSLTRLLIAHHHRSDVNDASDDILPKMEYVMPFALLFGYTALIIPTIYNLWWLVVPVSLSALAWLIYPLFKWLFATVKWLYATVRGRYDAKLHKSLKLHLVEKGANELTVCWHGDSELTYEARADGGLYRRTESPFEHTFHGLTPRTNYRISIRAVSKYGARGTPVIVYLGTAEVEGRHQVEASG